MVLTGLIQEVLAILNGLLGHFVVGAASQFTQAGDNEWIMTQGGYLLSAKGNNLVGAVADILVYGAILGDWIVQSLLGTPVNVYVP